MSHTDRPAKRRRTGSDEALPTPPALDLERKRRRPDVEHLKDEDDSDKGVLNHALHVLQTEAAALAHIRTLYATSFAARGGLSKAVSTILEAQRTGKKLVSCGVGKSAHIAQKFTATCKSLSIRASFLHACEAVHGDLGDVREGDVLMFVSYSGRTPELVNLLPFLLGGVSVLALTGQTKREECRLLDRRDGDEGILLPAPVHETEEMSFGVAAPTTSTTVALAVTDMLALTLAEEMHGERKREVFQRNHPGGAIGMTEVAREVKRVKKEVVRESEVVPLDLPPSPDISGEDDR